MKIYSARTLFSDLANRLTLSAIGKFTTEIMIRIKKTDTPQGSPENGKLVLPSARYSSIIKNETNAKKTRYTENNNINMRIATVWSFRY